MANVIPLPAASNPTVIRAGISPPPLVVRPRTFVAHDPSFLESRGWTETEPHVYHGHFVSASDGRRFAGRIVERNGKVAIHMLNPTAAVLEGIHGPCFHRQGNDGWYQVHLRKVGADVASQILGVEACIA